MTLIHLAREKARETGAGGKGQKRPGKGLTLYERAFGLEEKPFAEPPDPKFLFYSPAHREALAGLILGLRENRGLLSLTGEAGTGKSLLLHTLLEQSAVAARAVFIHHTTLNRAELLSMILKKLRLEDPASFEPGLFILEDRDFFDPVASGKAWTRVEQLCRLSDYVEEEARFGRAAPLLIIDEAQNLSPELLEEVRLFNNLEQPRTKLLQIILSGQPALAERLESAAQSPLHQRVAFHARLRPLTETEVASYIAHRLKIAGVGQRKIFTDGAVHAIAEASGGIPRSIHSICEQSFINAYGARKQEIDLSLAKEAIRDLSRRTALKQAAREVSGAAARSEAASDEAAPMYGVCLASFQEPTDAKIYAEALTTKGHEARAVKAMLPDGRYVAHVMADVFADRRQAEERARLYQEGGLTQAEVLELSGWTSAGTLHTATSSKSAYIGKGPDEVDTDVLPPVIPMPPLGKQS